MASDTYRGGGVEEEESVERTRERRRRRKWLEVRRGEFGKENETGRMFGRTRPLRYSMTSDPFCNVIRKLFFFLRGEGVIGNP